MKFSELKLGMADISPGGDGGVLKRTVQAGAGQCSEPVIPERARVKIHYKIEVETYVGDEEGETVLVAIDSTWFRGKAECHKIGGEEGALMMVRTQVVQGGSRKIDIGGACSK